MTVSLQQAMEEAGGAMDYVRTIDSHANSNHLKFFADIPQQTTNWRQEQQAWADSVAVADLSHHMYDLHVEGPDALQLFADLGVNDFSNVRPGKAKQFVACSPDGYLIGDGILFCLDDDSYTLVGYGPINWVKYHAETGDYDVTYSEDPHGGVREGPPETFRYQVQGPDALAVIDEVIDGDLPDIGFFNFGEVSIAGHDVNALRHGMMNEAGYEFFGPWDVQGDVLAAIMDAGADYGIERIGAMAYPTNVIPAAWMSVPLPAVFHDGMEDYREWLGADEFEGALTIAGSLDSEDITDHYLTPVGAGHDRLVDLDHDFVGRDAVAEQMDADAKQKVTLVWDRESTKQLTDNLFEDAPARRYPTLPMPEWALTQNDLVLKDGEQVGVANNTRYLYFERNMFSLCAIDAEYAEPGTEVTVVWGQAGETGNPRVEEHVQTEITATVAPAPYFEDKRKTADYTAAN